MVPEFIECKEFTMVINGYAEGNLKGISAFGNMKIARS